FVSSRRRHTRFSRDWSSDVCSSDLVVLGQSYRSEYAELLFARGTAISPAPSRAAEHFWYLQNATDFDLNGIGDADNGTLNANLRSEERRVGKECICRW